jgi:hypothetical protein
MWLTDWSGLDWQIGLDQTVAVIRAQEGTPSRKPHALLSVRLKETLETTVAQHGQGKAIENGRTM